MEQMKKWTKGVVTGIYSVVLPMESPMDIKKNVILNYSVGDVLKNRR